MMLGNSWKILMCLIQCNVFFHVSYSHADTSQQCSSADSACSVDRRSLQTHGSEPTRISNIDYIKARHGLSLKQQSITSTKQWCYRDGAPAELLLDDWPNCSSYLIDAFCESILVQLQSSENRCRPASEPRPKTLMQSLPWEPLPLGFVILVQDEAKAAIRLIERLWREEHHFVLHVDLKAQKETMQILQHWSSNFSNVEIVNEFSVVRGAFSLFQAQVYALGRLLHRSNWHMALMLTATHYPIQPTDYLERYLWLRNLSHMVVEVDDNSDTHLRIVAECANEVRLLRNRAGESLRLPLPLHRNLSYSSGSSHVTILRALAQDVVNSMGNSTTPAGSVGPTVAHVLRICKLLPMPDEKCWQLVVENTQHCQNALTLWGLTVPKNEFGPARSSIRGGAEFPMESPKIIDKGDLKRVRALQAKPVQTFGHAMFIRKVSDDDLGHLVRDSIDARLNSTSSKNSKLRKVPWSLVHRFASLHADTLQSKSVCAQAEQSVVSSVKAWGTTLNAGLEPWAALIAGGILQKVTYSFCGERHSVSIRERFAIADGNGKQVVAIRVGVVPTVGSGQEFLDVGILPAGHEIRAAVYWSPRNHVEVSHGAFLRAVFMHNNQIRGGGLLQMKAKTAFTKRTVTLQKDQAVPGRWLFLLEYLPAHSDGQDDISAERIIAKVPFYVYKHESMLNMSNFRSHFMFVEQAALHASK